MSAVLAAVFKDHKVAEKVRTILQPVRSTTRAPSTLLT
jgi:hypothetical protein